MKEPVIVQKISQLREGNLNLKFGSPVCFIYQPTSFALDGTFGLPIIRSAGLPATLEAVAGEASFDGSFSAIIDALTPRWPLRWEQTMWIMDYLLPRFNDVCRKVSREV